MDTEIIVAIIGFLGVALGYLMDEVKQKQNDSKATQKALKILLRKEIKDEYDVWKDKGFISNLALQEFNDTLEVYNELVGKNGYVDDIETKVKTLEVRG